MKRVFEGIVFERRRIGDNAIGACTTESFEEFYQSLPIGKATRITAEDLSESKLPSADKPEPEKNCGNCAIDYNRCTQHERKYGCDAWQPKADEAKAEGWEQRFDKEFPCCGGAFKTSVKAFIRAEIDRAWGDGFKAGHDIAEENRSEK